jgi:outer membrane protein assembly factor BamD
VIVNKVNVFIFSFPVIEIKIWLPFNNQIFLNIIRFKNVVREYETTSQVEEALHRMVEAYVTLGVIGEAKKVGSVLGYNYPDSAWYQDSYDLLQEYGVDLDDEIAGAPDRSYFDRLRDRLF